MEIERFIIENDVERCYCSFCKEYHDCSEFGINRAIKHGYSNTCKEGKRKQRNIMPKSEIDEYISNESKRILRECGYVPSSKIPIHEQFLLKHDL